MHFNLTDLFLKMQEQLDQPQAVLDENLMIELVNRLRPKNPNDAEEVKQRIHSLIKTLLLTPTSAILLQNFLLKLISQYKQISLYADSGILSLDGFWNQFFCKLSRSIIICTSCNHNIRIKSSKIGIYQKFCSSFSCSIWT